MIGFSACIQCVNITPCIRVPPLTKPSLLSSYMVSSVLQTTSQALSLLAICCSLTVFLYIPHMRDNSVSVPFPPTSLSMVLTRSIHIAVNYMTLSFLLAEKYSIMNKYHAIMCGLFPVNSATMNIEV